MEEGTTTPPPTATSPTPEKMMSPTIDTDIVWNWQRQKLMGDFEQPFEGEEDLGSESSVDLGEGSVDCEYLNPSYQDHLFHDPEYRLALYVDLLKLRKPETDIDIHKIREILSLPFDEIPRELQNVKLDMLPYRTPEEEAFYLRVAIRSDRFEAPYFPERNSGDAAVPYSYNDVHGFRSNELEGYCNQAIEEYNRKKDTFYKFKYLIKVVGHVWLKHITFALTDGKYKPYVGRFSVKFPFKPHTPAVVHELRITRGEYRVPRWQRAGGQEYNCEVNEVYREKLPELEDRWKQKMGLMQ